MVTTTIRRPFDGRSTACLSKSKLESGEFVYQSINIRLIKVVRRNLKQLKYWQCVHSIKLLKRSSPTKFYAL